MARKIVSVVQVKGGCGRSTVATNIAAELSKVAPTLLIDADLPQGTAASWAAVRQEAGLAGNLAAATATTYLELIALVDNSSAKYVVIDSPPRLAEVARAAIALADLTLTPVTPSMLDLWATADVLALLDAAAAAGQKAKSRMLWNRHRATGKTAAEVIQFAQKEINVPFMASTLGNRIAYARAGSQGRSATEVKDATAAGEVLSLVAEIRGILR